MLPRVGLALLLCTAVLASLPAAAEELEDPASYAGFAVAGCGKLGTRDRRDPAPDGSNRFVRTASFDIVCERGDSGRIGIQIDKAGMMLVRRFYYLTGAAHDMTFVPSVQQAIRGACGCQ